MADELKSLVERAFLMARNSGRPGWNRMTIAVLKNRLLQLTNRTFTETEYAGASLLELLRTQCSDIVAVDMTTRPPTVEWKDVSALDAAAAPPAIAGRIRSDLWNAIVDYSSGMQYVWDVVHGQARRVKVVTDPKQRLPTLTDEILESWRKEFAAMHEATVAGTDDEQRLATWLSDGLGTQHLPKKLQRLWNEYLKQQVISRLQEWFKKFPGPTPAIVQEPKEQQLLPVSSGTELRQFVHRCVDIMSEDELRGLLLPAAVMLRVRD